MGIGNSKSNAAEGERLPAKIRPMLVSRFEAFRKGRNGETTLSKKNLLNEEDDNSQSSNRTEAEDKVSSSKEIEPPKEETVERVITAEKLSRVVPVPNSECENVEETHPNKDNIEQVIKDMDPSQDILNRAVEIAEAEVKAEEEKTAELVEETKEEKKQEVGAKGDDHHEDSDDEDESEEVGRFLCPGSPSFRIYCVEAEKRNEEECNGPTIVLQKSRSLDSVETAEPTNSNEVLQGLESTSKRKRHKKKFGAMKTLLKVKSFYHPMCTCTGDDKSHIVTAKATK